MTGDLLTPQQRRTLQAGIATCGECRQLLDLAASLGHEDRDLRERIDHREHGLRSALEIADASRGTGGAR